MQRVFTKKFKIAVVFVIAPGTDGKPAAYSFEMKSGKSRGGA